MDEPTKLVNNDNENEDVDLLNNANKDSENKENEDVSEDRNIDVELKVKKDESKLDKNLLHPEDFTDHKDTDKSLPNKPKESIRFKDELEEIFSIIEDNINDFNIDFNINKNVYLENKLVKSYISYLKKKKYLNYIIPNSGKDRKLDFINEDSNLNLIEENSQENDSSYSDDNENLMTDISTVDYTQNLSIHLLFELLSTEYIDLSTYYQNFYFRDSTQQSLFDFYQFIELFLFNDQNYVSDITDQNKVATALKYYHNEIFIKWMNIYQEQNDKGEF